LILRIDVPQILSSTAIWSPNPIEEEIRRKKRFSGEQIVGFVREAEAGVAVRDLGRKYGFSEVPYYLWRSKCGGASSHPSTPRRDNCWEHTAPE